MRSRLVKPMPGHEYVPHMPIGKLSTVGCMVTCKRPAVVHWPAQCICDRLYAVSMPIVNLDTGRRNDSLFAISFRLCEIYDDDCHLAFMEQHFHVIWLAIFILVGPTICCGVLGMIWYYLQAWEWEETIKAIRQLVLLHGMCAYFRMWFYTPNVIWTTIPYAQHMSKSLRLKLNIMKRKHQSFMTGYARRLIRSKQFKALVIMFLLTNVSQGIDKRQILNGRKGPNMSQEGNPTRWTD